MSKQIKEIPQNIEKKPLDSDSDLSESVKKVVNVRKPYLMTADARQAAFEKERLTRVENIERQAVKEKKT